MKRWNWWLAYQVLRGRVRSVAYESRGRLVTVELIADGNDKRLYDRVRPR